MNPTSKWRPSSASSPTSDSMRFALVSDAWRPQVNGVARTLAALHNGLTAAGHEVFPLTPDLFRTVPCPTDREVRLAIGHGRASQRLLEALTPDAIHIATEGPLGPAARRYCISRDLHFTTAYHTKYPEYLRARFGVPHVVDLRGIAPVSSPVERGHGRHRNHSP